MRRIVATITATIALILLGLGATGFLEAFSIVARAADFPAPLYQLASLSTVRHVERLTAVQVEDDRSIRVRIYAPAAAARHTLLLVSGLHTAGIDEPRLIAFARELARSRLTVVTPEIPGLAQFSITRTLTDDIERVARWLAVDSGLAASGRIGLVGISFSGGLAIVAAGRPSLRDRVLYVLSVGGHGDLPRVLRYLCTGVVPEPDTSSDSPNGLAGEQPPNDYGVAIVLLNVAERLVPAEQVERLRTLVRRFLWASYLDRHDKAESAREFDAVRKDALAMPEPSATLLKLMIERDVKRLGLALLPYIDEYGNDPALSPSRSPSPLAVVFVMHGRSDDVIPAVEAKSLAAHLGQDTCVKLLLTDLLSHARVDQPKRVAQVFEMVGFWRDLLEQAEDHPEDEPACVAG